MKATVSPSEEEIKAQREWYVVDATGATLGRLATQIATVLRGKHKPTFSPNMDSGDFVIVTNCERIVVTAGVPFDVPGTTNQLKVETV